MSPLEPSDGVVRDGLYRIAFRTELGAGAGIAVLIDGRVRGGDAHRYFFGQYQPSGEGRVRVALQICRHALPNAARSVFGADDIRLDLEGQVAGDEAVLAGQSPEVPGLRFEAVLSRLAD